jgi:hypothetical protein
VQDCTAAVLATMMKLEEQDYSSVVAVEHRSAIASWNSAVDLMLSSASVQAALGSIDGSCTLSCAQLLKVASLACKKYQIGVLPELLSNCCRFPTTATYDLTPSLLQHACSVLVRIIVAQKLISSVLRRGCWTPSAM